MTNNHNNQSNEFELQYQHIRPHQPSGPRSNSPRRKKRSENQVGQPFDLTIQTNSEDARRSSIDDKSGRLILNLQTENIQLRNSLEELQYEVANLREWKERSVAHMTRLAPQRNRIQKEKEALTSLRKQYGHLEESAKLCEKREHQVALDQAQLRTLTRELQLVKIHAEDLERKASRAIQSQREWKHAGEEIQATLCHMIERLTQTCGSSPNDQNSGNQEIIPKVEFSGSNQHRPTYRLAIEQALERFETYLKSGQTQARAQAQAETELANEKRKNQELVHQLEKGQQVLQQVTQTLVVEKAVSQGLEYLHREKDLVLTELNEEYVQVREQQFLDHRCCTKLLDDIRLYAQSLHSEVKKKFGYIPDAISRPEVWDRLAFAFEDLDVYKRVYALK